MRMRLSYFLTQNNHQTAIRGTLVRLCEITALPADQWEICLAQATDATIEYIRGEFPNNKIVHGPTVSACSGQCVIPLGENMFPVDGITVASIISHLEKDAHI